MAASSSLLIAGPLVVREIVDRATCGGRRGELRSPALVFLAVVVITVQVLDIGVVRAATVGAWRTMNDLWLETVANVLGLDDAARPWGTPATARIGS